MKKLAPVSVDFETEAIEKGAPLLPKPVGCSIEYLDGSKPTKYWSWGHPTENNCTWEEFREELLSIWGREWITQNGCGFDAIVARHWFDLPERDPLLTHDTLFQAYLHNPHAASLHLKDMADTWLGIPPDEQQELYDWIMANVPECRSRKQCGAFICRAPGGLVGKYADGDTLRATKLWEFLTPLIADMSEAYDRERLLAPILADLRNIGVRCDVDRLRRDYRVALDKLNKIEGMIREYLDAPDLNPGSSAQLGKVLADKGYKGFLLTPTGKPSMSEASLDLVLAADPKLKKMLYTRHVYATLTGTFMGPWLEMADRNGGRLHASYNQVRNPDGFGTRTGRLSSSEPNFQNVPNEFEENDFWDDPFPMMRSYLLPEEGHVWVCGDLKNQEPRLAAHFEDGEFCRRYNENPDLDPYLLVCDICSQPHTFRKPAKIIFLGLLYTMGLGKLADKLGSDESYAATVRNIIRAGLPDLMKLDRECKARFRRGLPIRTLGGRLYYCEPPKDGRTWEYKALNTLIQGSAADQTKEALIYTHREIQKRPHLKLAGVRILGTVHDEWSVSTPPQFVDEVKQIMSEAANALPCDVPMLLDFGVGDNWKEAA